MGAAKQRREALAWGQPDRRDMHRCPKCSSWRTMIEPAPAMGLSHVPTLMGICADCETLWEAYPADWSHDAVEASPCDNCAFARGSPEAEDREGWRELLAKLRGGSEFLCHKGAPILLDTEAGTVEFDQTWLRLRGRTCAGFLRAMQRWPDWLSNRYPHIEALRTAEGFEPIAGPLQRALAGTPIAPPQEHDARSRDRMADPAPQPGRGETPEASK